MKKSLALLATTLLCLGLMPAFAQMGRMPGGPNLDGAMKKLFGDNQSFTADLETQIKQASGDEITMPGKVSFDAGNSRFEIDLNDAKGLKMPPNAAAQMKSMGLDHMISITLPKKDLMFLIYPGLNSYVKTRCPPPTPPMTISKSKPPRWAKAPWTATTVCKTKWSSPVAMARRTNSPSGTRRI